MIKYKLTAAIGAVMLAVAIAVVAATFSEQVVDAKAVSSESPAAMSKLCMEVPLNSIFAGDSAWLGDSWDEQAQASHNSGRSTNARR